MVFDAFERALELQLAGWCLLYLNGVQTIWTDGNVHAATDVSRGAAHVLNESWLLHGTHISIGVPPCHDPGDHWCW